MQTLLSVPMDLVHFVLLEYLDLSDLAQLAAVCRTWQRFIMVKHAKLLCEGVVTKDLLKESKMTPLELLDFWKHGQQRVSCGEDHGAMITKSGVVLMWREGHRRSPVVGMPAGLKAISVSCGYGHTLIIGSDNHAYSFGSNNFGQLSTGDHIERLLPTRVLMPADEKIVNAVCGKGFSLFSTSANKLFWSGDLDVDAKDAKQGIVMPEYPCEIALTNFERNEKITKICAGAKHILVLTNRNRLFSAGRNEHLQLGRLISPESSSRCLGLVEINTYPSCRAIVQISAGVAHSLILFGDGSVYSFGKSSSGELGLPRFEDAVFPRKIPNLPNALALSAGHQHSLILAAEENKIVAFGMGALGQLGYRASFWSSTYPRDSPLPKDHARRIKYLGAGGGFSVCLSGDCQELFACGKSSLCAGAGHGENSGSVLPFFSRVPEENCK
jgi:alpha-tubulin suppressor-like RCC1 family protein